MASRGGLVVAGVHIHRGGPGGTAPVGAPAGVPVDLEKKEAYYLRMHFLIVKEVTALLRARFDLGVPPHQLHATLQNSMNTLNYAKNKNLLNKTQWGLLFPPFHPPSSSTFDVILLAYLLRHICGLKTNSKWWGETDNSKIPDIVVTEEADIVRLRNLRNDMLHKQVALLEPAEFEDMWDLVEKAILRLSSKKNMDIEDKKKKLDVLKNKQLDSVTGELTNNKDHSGSSQPILSVQDEQESEQMSQEYSCLYDGRLIELTESTVRNLRNENTDEIGKGSFGKVYGSGRTSKRFGMDVVVKKIPLDNGQEKSVRREMIASRIVHPFILPLLAASMVQQCDGRKEFWFVTPRCRNGDLFTVLKEYRENKDARVKLNAVKRVKIIFQLALAIKYIHTAVRGVRSIILHKDIASKNVLLDDNCNARLIYFGLAREEDDETSIAGGRLLYSHPGVGHGCAKESWDYYSFGVIVREMITSFGPEGEENIYLKHIAEKDVKMDENIWKYDELGNIGQKLTELSTCLLEQTDWKVRDFTKNVIDELHTIWIHLGESCLLEVSKGVNDETCHSCMINKKAKQTSMNQRHIENCNQKIEVCIACEKNSFLNPVTCYCGLELTPSIGNRWGALLIAGTDADDDEVTKALTQDVMDLKRVLISQAPRVFGISERNVRTVVPSTLDNLHDKEELWPKTKDCIRHFSETTDIDTLLIFLSCHGTKTKEPQDGQFQLGSNEDDNISLENFEKELERLENIEKLIVVLDRCYPPVIRFKKRERIYVQINSCKGDQQAKMDRYGSIFTRFFIGGLKAKSEGGQCSDKCECCIKYWNKSTDFITVDNLFDYVSCHLSEQTPTRHTCLHHHSSNIAFFTGVTVEINFNCKNTSTGTKIPLEYLNDIDQLKTILKKQFKRENVTDACISRNTFRKRKGDIGQVCDILEKVMLAWVLRQPLEVVFSSE